MLVDHHLLICFTIDGHWATFQSGTITNGSTVNTPVRVFCRADACVSLGFILGGETVKSYGLHMPHSRVNNILPESFKNDSTNVFFTSNAGELYLLCVSMPTRDVFRLFYCTIW